MSTFQKGDRVAFVRSVTDFPMVVTVPPAGALGTVTEVAELDDPQIPYKAIVFVRMDDYPDPGDQGYWPFYPPEIAPAPEAS